VHRLRGVSVPAGDDQPLCLVVLRFPLNFREVEEMILRRGVVVSHETVRQWCAKFGQTYANALRRRRVAWGTSGTEVFTRSTASASRLTGSSNEKSSICAVALLRSFDRNPSVEHKKIVYRALTLRERRYSLKVRRLLPGGLRGAWPPEVIRLAGDNRRSWIEAAPPRGRRAHWPQSPDPDSDQVRSMDEVNG
jgi:putative transposase